MGDWADKVIEYDRRRRAFLLDWQEEIDAVTSYGKVPVHPWDAVTIDPHHVVERLGPGLTAMAREVARLERAGQRQQGTGDPDHAAEVAWGARQALAIGVGVHIGLSREQATWLADALTGHDDQNVDDAHRWKAGQDPERKQQR